MAGVNKVILVGNLGRDPETRYTASGAAVTTASLATSETWRDKQSGEKQEKTEWHRLVFFQRQAEVAGEYLSKGSTIFVEGQLQTRKWQDKDSGQDRYTTEVVVRNFQMLGGKSDRKPAGPTPAPKKQEGFRDKTPAPAGNDFSDDDNPF